MSNNNYYKGKFLLSNEYMANFNNARSIKREELDNLLEKKHIQIEGKFELSKTEVTYIRLWPNSFYFRKGNFKLNSEIVTHRNIILAPDTIIGARVNSFRIPRVVSAHLILEGAYLKKGIHPLYQGIVDPGYSGKLDFILINGTDKEVDINLSDPICLVVLETPNIDSFIEDFINGTSEYEQISAQQTMYTNTEEKNDYISNDTLSDTSTDLLLDIVKHPDFMSSKNTKDKYFDMLEILSDDYEIQMKEEREQEYIWIVVNDSGEGIIYE